MREMSSGLTPGPEGSAGVVREGEEESVLIPQNRVLLRAGSPTHPAATAPRRPFQIQIPRPASVPPAPKLLEDGAL